MSVYLDDDESVALWKRVAGLADDRIHRLGMADNYWSMGIPGPCGPDSELFFDRGPEYGPEGDIEKAGDRYMEFWNLVFMQNMRGEGIGKDDFEILGDLPQKNIDTGMGLERMAMLLQGKGSIYEIDEVYPVLAQAAELAGKTYGANHDDDVRLRVVADHVRSGLMLIGDGVTPGNEARGYVLRRILRRVVRVDAAARRRGPDAARAAARLATRRCGCPTPSSTPSGRGSRRWRTPRRTRSARRSRPGRRSSTWRRARPSSRAARRCPARRRSSCTTRTASRSTSRSRWPPSRDCASTRSASAT